MKRGLGSGDVVADRFRLLSEVGEGGMGRVFEAVDLLHDRPAAVKLIYRRLAVDQVFRDRFEREALAAERATHPHVLPVWDHGAAGDHLYLATPLCDTDLAALLDEQGRLEPDVALDIIGQIAWALDWAHGRSVVHRDVKPENILIVAGPGERHAYLADFGLARIATTATLTQFGVSVGLSPAYAAPEQWQGKRVSPAADQYALAGTLYFCLTGRSPFWPINEFEALRRAHLVGRPETMDHATDPRVRSASDAVLRGLEKDPADRYASCGDLVVAVRDVVRREGTPSAAPEARERSGAYVTTEPEQPSSARARDGADAQPRAPVAADERARAADPAEASVAPTARSGETGAAEQADETVRPAPVVAPTRRRVLLIALVFVVVAAGAGAVLLLGGDDQEVAGEVLPAVRLGGRPTDAVSAGGAVWVADQAAGTLRRLDPRTAEPSGDPVRVVPAPFRLAGASGQLWAISSAGPRAGGIDPGDGSAKPRAVSLPSDPGDIAVGEGGVWIAANPSGPGEGGALLALDATSGRVVSNVPTTAPLDAVAAGQGAVWALEGRPGRLDRIRPRAPAVIATVEVGPGSSAVVADASGVWVADGRAGRLVRIDPRQNRVTARVPVARAASVGLAAGGGAVWWIDRGRGTVTRVDADGARRVGAPLRVGVDAGGASVAAGSLWVTVPTARSVVRVRY